MKKIKMQNIIEELKEANKIVDDVIDKLKEYQAQRIDKEQTVAWIAEYKTIKEIILKLESIA